MEEVNWVEAVRVGMLEERVLRTSIESFMEVFD